jgi:hypothetical protein
MEEEKSTTPQVRDDILVIHVPNDELLDLTQSSDIPPEPRRQFSLHESRYSDSQLLQVRKRAIDHWIGPRYAEYCTLQARLNSFKDKWPEGKLPTPEALSIAWFFLDGKSYQQILINHHSHTLPYTYFLAYPCRMERCNYMSSLRPFPI